MTVSEKGSCVEDEQDCGRGGGVKGLATRVGFGHAREPHAVISALAATTTLILFSILYPATSARRRTRSPELPRVLVLVRKAANPALRMAGGRHRGQLCR